MSQVLDLANLPDADVVALAQQGREPAYRELLRRYERPVFSLIFRMVRDRETAEDLAQETFIKVLNHIDRYRPEFKLSSWLFKIANNVAIDHLRKRTVETISIDGSPHAATRAEIEATSFDVESRGESASRKWNHASSARLSSARSPGSARSIDRASARHLKAGRTRNRGDARSAPGDVKTYIHRARKELRDALETSSD